MPDLKQCVSYISPDMCFVPIDLQANFFARLRVDCNIESRLRSAASHCGDNLEPPVNHGTRLKVVAICIPAAVCFDSRTTPTIGMLFITLNTCSVRSAFAVASGGLYVCFTCRCFTAASICLDMCFCGGGRSFFAPVYVYINTGSRGLPVISRVDILLDLRCIGVVGNPAVSVRIFPCAARTTSVRRIISVAHIYDHSFPLRSKAPKGMKHKASIAASRNLLEYA